VEWLRDVRGKHRLIHALFTNLVSELHRQHFKGQMYLTGQISQRLQSHKRADGSGGDLLTMCKLRRRERSAAKITVKAFTSLISLCVFSKSCKLASNITRSLNFHVFLAVNLSFEFENRSWLNNIFSDYIVYHINLCWTRVLESLQISATVQNQHAGVEVWVFL